MRTLPALLLGFSLAACGNSSVDAPPADASPAADVLSAADAPPRTSPRASPSSEQPRPAATP
ncbi:MAG: hypothetical protein IPN17_01530 [Deltaproteobacteria bacterium]|nr:hypothetical protein [Deltaproteobacteria bacterium]